MGVEDHGLPISSPKLTFTGWVTPGDPFQAIAFDRTKMNAKLNFSK